MASQRQLRVGEELRHILARLIQRGDFPQGDLPAPLTISRVDVSPDLGNAVVFVMPLGGEFQEKTLEVLRENAWYVRKNLSTHISLRRVPRLTFILDETFDKAERMHKILASV